MSSSHILQLYSDALTQLHIASVECQKTSNVDITLMLSSCRKCAGVIDVIKIYEYNTMFTVGLDQLSIMLSQHQEILTAKIRELDENTATRGGTNLNMERKSMVKKHAKCVVPIQKPVRNKKHKTSSSEHKDATTMSHSNSDSDMDNHKKTRRLAIEDTIVVKGHIGFDDVAGLNEAKQALKEAIIIPLQFPHLFTGNRKPWRRIMLYGPPGTGKSLLAQAVSSEIMSSFYSVSSSDLISSWAGESEKLIKELFQHSMKQEGRSVIFIDEIDSVCRKRTSREEEHTRRIKTELMKQMEGADNTEMADKIFLLCATNCPWEIDSAFLRRFQKRIYIPLPDRHSRLALMRSHTKNDDVELSDGEWQQLCDKTDGYSGSDIATMVLGALFGPIRDMQTSTHWKQIADGSLIPCSEETFGSFASNLSNLPSRKVMPRDVNIEDFLQSLSTHHLTITKEELSKFEAFTNHYGQNG